MWWGTAGNGYGMPYGMFMMPLFFLIIIAVLFYSFNRRNNSSYEDRRFSDGKDEILKELQELKEEVRELKKEKEKE